MKTKADSFPTVTVIARNLSSEQLHLIAEQMVATGIRSMEVSLVGDHACEDIRSLCNEFEGQLLIGAGTVLSLEDAKRSVDAGASFLLSPVQFGADVIDYAHECGVLAIPSGLTPTEIYKQLSLGAEASGSQPGITRASVEIALDVLSVDASDNHDGEVT